MMRLFPYTTREAPQTQAVPWNITMVNAPSFWQQTKGDGVVVAVIDTGIDADHPEFLGRVFKPQNFTRETSMDTEGHGTHVAGIIAGQTTGVAPEARIMPLKVFGEGDGLQFQDAFRYILDHNHTASDADKVMVVNCSWGGPYDPVIHWLIRRLNSEGVTVVCSAGNAGDGDPTTEEMFNWPGFLWEPITVGAVNQDATAAKYSSSYDGIDLGAPGTDIYSAWPGGGYKLLSGTSMAAPHVSGAMALIYAAWRKREGRWPTCEEAERVLFNHARKVPVDPNFVGEGLLDLTWETKRWPLHRVQVGAFYYTENYERTKDQLEAAGFKTYHAYY